MLKNSESSSHLKFQPLIILPYLGVGCPYSLVVRGSTRKYFLHFESLPFHFLSEILLSGFTTKNHVHIERENQKPCTH